MKVMHYSAALSVFKSTRTTYLFNQHFPPVIKSSILIVWGFFVLFFLHFAQLLSGFNSKNEDHLRNLLRAAHEGLKENILQQRRKLHWWTDPGSAVWMEFGPVKSAVTSQALGPRNSWWKRVCSAFLVITRSDSRSALQHLQHGGLAWALAWEEPSWLKRQSWSQADDWWLCHISEMRCWRLWGDRSLKLASQFRGRVFLKEEKNKNGFGPGWKQPWGYMKTPAVAV